MIAIDDLLSWLGNPGEPNVLTVLEALEGMAVDIVQRETGRYFGPVVEHVELLSGVGTARLRLRERPDEVALVEHRMRPGDAWADVDGFELYTLPRATVGSELVRTGHQRWLLGHEYQATYNFGYAEGEEPGEIRAAVMDVVDLLYHDRTRKGLRSESIGDYSYTALVGATGRGDIMAAAGHGSTLVKWRGAVLA